MYIAFHVNPALQHQREHYEWFRSGLKRYGLDLELTYSPSHPADIHIISGPHFAKANWLNHPNVILIDRAYIPEHQVKSGEWVSEDWISVGWMNPLGGRNFIEGKGRDVPEVGTPTGDKTIFLADYNGPIEGADTVRLHPQNRKYESSLAEALHGHHYAIGYETTALVTAGLAGLEVICKGKSSIMLEPNWLQLLPYADWHYSEINSGELWDHLRLSRDLLSTR